MLINNPSAPYRVEMNCSQDVNKTPSLCGLVKVQNGDQFIETSCLLAVHMPEMGKDIHVHQDKIITDIKQPNDSNNNAGINIIQTWQRDEKKAELTERYIKLQTQLVSLINDKANIYDELSLNLREDLSTFEQLGRESSQIEQLRIYLLNVCKVRRFVPQHST